MSPCTEIAEMTPKAIVRTAMDRELDMIAICDHNSSRNASATLRAAKGTGLTVISGMEITSSEEVHILGLFPTDREAQAVQEEVYARLIGQNQEEVFGYQVVVDEDDQVEDLDQRLLIGATTLSCERVVKLIHDFRGLAIASHVDRQGFGIFSQLGFIPPGLKLDGLEISKRTDEESVLKRFPQSKDYSLITSSDAHYLEDIGSAVTVAKMAEPSFDELGKALQNLEGRKILELKTR
ncbi:MAG: histidinol phosphatase [Desulfomonile tiedjei]|uniref:Histidinol phosphatase n=1 Tax=Desulfomonile tiedjei TaxID=2358 RepID=A0A9D6Z518_9BACT|nr:histidinol phosphatase [Desulfomonile tiedjei]